MHAHTQGRNQDFLKAVLNSAKIHMSPGSAQKFTAQENIWLATLDIAHIPA